MGLVGARARRGLPCDREIERERGAATELAAHGDDAVVALGGGVDRGQAEARSLAGWLGGEEGFEDVAPHFLGHAGAGVAEVDAQVFAWMNGPAVLHDLGRAQPHVLGADAQRAAAGAPRLRFAVVHPESAHNYTLRYWLAASGIDPDRAVDIVIVPPPFQADALAARHTDGYCVGEPFGSVAVQRGVGRIVTTKGQIWNNSPDKVLGTRLAWAEQNPERLAALLRAATRAARWCEDPSNYELLAAMLAREDRIGIDASLLLRAITGRLHFVEGRPRNVEDFFVPYSRAANFPWVSHALWFYSQMVRWGQVAHTPQNAARAAASYRPDLYRAALTGGGFVVPGASSKIEGDLPVAVDVGASGGRLTLGPDAFFDGSRFDPDQLDSYIASQQD